MAYVTEQLTRHFYLEQDAINELFDFNLYELSLLIYVKFKNDNVDITEDEAKSVAKALYYDIYDIWDLNGVTYLKVSLHTNNKKTEGK